MNNPINTISPPKTGHLLYGIKVPHDMTTTIHEQAIHYELQSALSSDIFKTLMDGRKFTVHISNIDNEEYDDDSFSYFIQARILVADLDEAEVGDYVELSYQVKDDAVEFLTDDMTFQLDEIGWHRVK